jgi:RNA polymerase sigma-70 factor (sigma-E family)
MESLRGLAYLTCGDWQVAEDAVFSALTRLYARWSRVDNPAAYARTAVVRAAIDEVRRPWWRREHSAGDAIPERAEAHDSTVAVDDRLRMRDALEKLPPRVRAVLVLRYLEDLSVEQTAELLDAPPGTVKSYTSRGLDALRALLGVDLSVNKGTKERHEARAV